MPDNDATIKINVSANKMKVTANFTPATGNGKPITPNDVLDKLESMNINTGIKDDIIEKMCKSVKTLKLIEIAQGIPPKIGEKARIETLLDLNRFGKAQTRKDGSMDFKELGEVYSANKGDQLYRKIPPAVGDPGYDVYGNEIPGESGKDLKIAPGSGTEIDTIDPDLVIASINGKVSIQNGILQISAVHKVKSDVDFSTGNVRFNGSVVIEGNVKSGFEVDASGSIEIKGIVEDATVNGSNDIIIHGGCTGTGEGKIIAKNDIYVKFVENQYLEAGGDIIINGESFHATLKAGRSIKAKKGIIVGGLCAAKISVEADYFGSVAATPTIIKLGIDPKLTEKIQMTVTEIEQAQISLEKLEKSVVFLYKQKIDSNGVLPPDKQKLLAKLEEAKKTMPQKLENLNNEKENFLKQQENIVKAYAVAVRGVYPKVQVYIGNQSITNDETLGPSQFRLVDSEVMRLSN